MTDLAFSSVQSSFPLDWRLPKQVALKPGRSGEGWGVISMVPFSFTRDPPEYDAAVY